MKTVRSQILVACLVMSVITATLGVYATLGIRHIGDLVTKTYDQSLMSISYARAASADFAAMRTAASMRLLTSDAIKQRKFDEEIDRLAKTLSEDLTVAAERSNSPRASRAAAKAQTAADAWIEAQGRRTTDSSNAADHSVSLDDPLADVVNEQVELLVNYTAGDGFLFRQRALAEIAKELQLNIAGLAIALLLSGIISWFLARRIIGPVTIASTAAKQIAEGDLNTNIPLGGKDELGALLTAMGAMRDKIRAMVEREIAQRRSAQARLADALESSTEGVVMLDANGAVALANSQANEYLARLPSLLLANAPQDNHAPADPRTATEVELPDGRWLRVGRSTTQEGGEIVVCSDISVLKKQKAELRATNLSLDAALDNMSQGLCLYGSDNCLRVVNRRFYEIFELPQNLSLVGKTFSEVLGFSVAAGNHDNETVPDLLADHKRALDNGSGCYYKNLSRNRVISVVRQLTSDGGWLATYEDITEKRRAESEIAFMARHDTLTKLPNRALLAERIEQALQQADRGQGFAVFCLDLDNFKQVNDTLGHPIGDQLLCAVAKRLEGCVREADTVARLGGDEFAIIQCGVSSAEEAALLARRVVERISAPYEFNGQRVTIGCSTGISLAPGDGSTGEKLLKNADVALYRAKMDGRGTWRFFEPDMDARLQARRALELDLREAIEENQFELFYQPFYDLRSNKISGFEALLRWRHPTRGLVSPDQFIPIAEEIGLIIPIGAWVLRTACEQAALWPDDLKVAVNVSAVQFRSLSLIADLEKSLSRSKLPAHRLELEITESVLLANSAETLATLHKLKAYGLHIALDDFGTGYSSLSYLRSFPFDKLKIDRSFVKDVTAENGSQLIVRAIVSLGRSLGMKVIAEGVETTEQLDKLRLEGCHEVQGFLFSEPLPATEIAATIMRWENAAAKKDRMPHLTSVAGGRDIRG